MFGLQSERKKFGCVRLCFLPKYQQKLAQGWRLVQRGKDNQWSSVSLVSCLLMGSLRKARCPVLPYSLIAVVDTKHREERSCSFVMCSVGLYEMPFIAPSIASPSCSRKTRRSLSALGFAWEGHVGGFAVSCPHFAGRALCYGQMRGSRFFLLVGFLICSAAIGDAHSSLCCWCCILG